MASTLKTKISLVFETVRTYVDTVVGGTAGGPLTANVKFNPAEMTDGTTANKADLEWQDTRTLNTTSETLDLTALTDPKTSGTVNFAEIVALYLRPNTTTTAKTIVWGNAASTSFQGPLSASATETVQAGGMVCHFAPVDGWTTSSLNSLKLTTNYDGTYTIKIVGRSA